MTYSDKAKSLYFSEAANNLRREGFEVEKLTEGHLAVSIDNQPICEITSVGGITYKTENLQTADLEAAKDQAFFIVRITAEYVQQMQIAEPLKVVDLQDRFKVLADYNGTVLAAAESKHGVQFVTWDWDFDRKGVSHGHYFNGDYEGAKTDFVTRSGLIPHNRLFSEAQLVEIYRCCSDTLASQYDLSPNEEKIINEVCSQIEMEIPDVADHLNHEQSMQGQTMC